MTSKLEREVRFYNGSVVLAGSLAACDGCDTGAGVVLISGSGANDRDETVCGHKPFRTISDFLVKCGFTVLRFDDRGVGRSGGQAAKTRFEDSVADAIAAASALRSLTDGRVDRVALCGHSEGGLVAAAAAEHVGDAVVLLTTPAGPIEDVLHHQARELSRASGASEAQIAHERRMNAQVFAAVRGAPNGAAAFERARDIILDHLRRWPERDEIQGRDDDLVRAAEVMACTVAGPDYRTLLQVDPPAVIAAVRQPLLAVFGGRDQQVPHPQSVESFLAARRLRPLASMCVFDDLNHLMQHAHTGRIDEYEVLGASPAPEVLEHVAGWLKRTLLPPGREI